MYYYILLNISIYKSSEIQKIIESFFVYVFIVIICRYCLIYFPHLGEGSLEGSAKGKVIDTNEVTREAGLFCFYLDIETYH